MASNGVKLDMNFLGHFPKLSCSLFYVPSMYLYVRGYGPFVAFSTPHTYYNIRSYEDQIKLSHLVSNCESQRLSIQSFRIRFEFFIFYLKKNLKSAKGILTFPKFKEKPSCVCVCVIFIL